MKQLDMSESCPQTSIVWFCRLAIPFGPERMTLVLGEVMVVKSLGMQWTCHAMVVGHQAQIIRVFQDELTIRATQRVCNKRGQCPS